MYLLDLLVPRAGQPRADNPRGDKAAGQKDSPFLLVEHGNDGLWHVHERTFDTSGILFNERQAACDYAAERARARKDAMILKREHPNAVVDASVQAKPGVTTRLLRSIW